MKHLILALAVPIIGLASGPTMATAETLTIGLASEPTAVDPHFHDVGPNNALALHLFDPLIRRDERQQQIPGLATS